MQYEHAVRDGAAVCGGCSGSCCRKKEGEDGSKYNAGRLQEYDAPKMSV